MGIASVAAVTESHGTPAAAATGAGAGGGTRPNSNNSRGLPFEGVDCRAVSGEMQILGKSIASKTGVGASHPTFFKKSQSSNTDYSQMAIGVFFCEFSFHKTNPSRSGLGKK